jgi:hypothetical protein
MTESNIGVAILHGIGSQDAGFAAPFVQLVKSELAKHEVPESAFEFQPVHWAQVLSPAEERLLRTVAEGGILDWTPLRMFVVETLADAVAYRRAYPREWDAYHQIHWEVFSALAELRHRMPHENAPLVAVGHSLGSVILSDHIWDEQKGRGFGRDPFTRCETLAGIITFGSNIPLFTLALPEVRCITFPPPAATLPAEVKAAARWCNYYDRDDVLGYPLRTLSDSYRDTVAEDVELSAGGIFTSWNPLSHNGYWTEKRFVESVARQLYDLYAVCADGAR